MQHQWIILHHLFSSDKMLSINRCMTQKMLQNKKLNLQTTESLTASAVREMYKRLFTSVAAFNIAGTAN